MNVYLYGNYQTKKALKAAVSAGVHVAVYSLSPFGTRNGNQLNGRCYLTGPNPYNRRWYAAVDVENGFIVKVVN